MSKFIEKQSSKHTVEETMRYRTVSTGCTHTHRDSLPLNKEDVQTMEQCKVADGAKLCLVCVPTAEDQQNRMEAGALTFVRDHSGNTARYFCDGDGYCSPNLYFTAPKSKQVIVRCRPPRARDVEIGSRRVVEAPRKPSAGN